MNKKGFTLAELLIFILIGAIAATIFFQFGETQQKIPKIKIAVDNIKKIIDAEKKYAMENNDDYLFPVTTDSLITRIFFDEKSIEDSLGILISGNGYFDYFIVTDNPGKDNQKFYIEASGTGKEDFFAKSDKIIFDLKNHKWLREGDILETDIPQNRK